MTIQIVLLQPPPLQHKSHNPNMTKSKVCCEDLSMILMVHMLKGYLQNILSRLLFLTKKIRQNVALNQDRQQELVAEKSQAFQHEEQQRVFSRSFG